MPKKFRVYDLYECYGVVSECDTLEEARKIVRSWKEETDGECELIIQRWSDTYYAYVCQEYIGKEDERESN